MGPRWVLLSLILCGVAPAARVHADTVFLKNGAAIDGIMVGKKAGVLLLQIGNLGRMEIPEKDIKHVEKNTRTGYVDPRRSTRKKKIGEQPVDDDPEGPERPGRLESDETPLDEETKKRVKSWVYDLTRQKIAHRVRAERRLTAIGSQVIPHVLPIANHPSELTRIAAFRIFKNVAKVGDARVIEPCLEALEDEKRFVRKMAWETLRKVSQKRFRFPWDDDNTERQRERGRKRWQGWWEKEQKRREAAAKSEKAAREGAGLDDGR